MTTSPPRIPFSQDAPVNSDKRTAEKIQSSVPLYGTNATPLGWHKSSNKAPPSSALFSVFGCYFFFVGFQSSK